MTLQHRAVKNGQIFWRDYTVDGEAVQSPVDIDGLPAGRYRVGIAAYRNLRGNLNDPSAVFLAAYPSYFFLP